MGIVDFILNLAGLLLWLNWRSIRFDPLMKRTPATLMGTLRPAAPQKMRRWHLLLFLVALLFLRAVLYHWLAPFWIYKLDFGLVVPSFRSDWFGGMILFSFLSFVVMLGAFYVALLFLSLLAGPDPIHALVKVPLGRMDDWSRGLKLLLPFLVTAIAWWLVSWVFSGMQILPPISMATRFEQACVIGLESYLVWKFPAGVLLLLYLLSSYIYFGKHPFWKYIGTTSQTLLGLSKRLPFPLRVGKVDFAPVLGLAVIFLLAEGVGSGLAWLYVRLPI